MLEPNVTNFGNAAKLGGAMDSLEGREASQRALDRLECWAAQDSLGDGGLEAALWKGLYSFGPMKMSALSVLAARRDSHVLGTSDTTRPAGQGRGLSPPTPAAAPPQVLCVLAGTSV